MLASSLFILALAATGFAQVNTTLPDGYRKVYLTSLQDKKFVIVPKTPVKAGTTLVVYVHIYDFVYFNPEVG